jgi:hypothetical protein
MRKHCIKFLGKFHNLSTIIICAVCGFVSTWLFGYLGSLFFLDIPIGCMISIKSLQELSRFHLPCGHSPSRPRLKHPLLCYIVPRVIHLALPRFSRIGRTTHRVHDPNSLQELSWYPLPCGHSPSRSRLRHPLIFYTVPRVIHLVLPRFSRTEIIPETLSSLIVKASLGLYLLRHHSGLCYLNTTYSK